jgi:hypothetical protein
VAKSRLSMTHAAMANSLLILVRHMDLAARVMREAGHTCDLWRDGEDDEPLLTMVCSTCGAVATVDVPASDQDVPYCITILPSGDCTRSSYHA